MTGFTFVYILVFTTDPTRFYVGLTDDLASRLRKADIPCGPASLQASTLSRSAP